MKRLNRILVAAAMACSAISVNAGPVVPGVWRDITLADGTQVHAQLRGDEFGSFWQDADGKIDAGDMDLTISVDN